MEGLPRFSGPVDHLRVGFHSLEAKYSRPHPIHALQRDGSGKEWLNKLDMVRRTYGSHMAMRLATEREFFSRMHRLPGLESSHIALDTVMGSDEKIQFHDFLNDPTKRPEMSPFEVHTAMEVKLGLI